MKNPTITFTTQSLDRLKYGNLVCYSCGATVQFKGECKKQFYAFIEPNIRTDHKKQSRVHIVCAQCVGEASMDSSLRKLNAMRRENLGVESHS